MNTTSYSKSFCKTRCEGTAHDSTRDSASGNSISAKLGVGRSASAKAIRDQDIERAHSSSSSVHGNMLANMSGLSTEQLEHAVANANVI